LEKDLREAWFVHPPLQGGEAEGGKGPVDLFPAERVRCTPAGIGVGMGFWMDCWTPPPS